MDSDNQQHTPTALAKLKLDKKFEPCPPTPGDEYYPNGIFHFNITKMLAFIQQNPGRFSVEQALIKDIPNFGGEHLDEETITAADLSRPILLAEISPGRYNVIDGNHRVEKARRQGVESVPAYRARCPARVPFLTSTFAYEKYVEYWNEKVKTLQAGSRSRRRR